MCHLDTLNSLLLYFAGHNTTTFFIEATYIVNTLNVKAVKFVRRHYRNEDTLLSIVELSLIMDMTVIFNTSVNGLLGVMPARVQNI